MKNKYKTNKIAHVFGLILISLILFSCGRNKDSQKIVIGITQNNVGVDSYQTTYDQALRTASADYPDYEIIILDAAGDVVKQISQIEDFILQEVDEIIVWPTNGEAIVPALKKAYAAGIPVVVTNSKVATTGNEYMTAFSGPDNIQQGVYAAQLVYEALGDQGKVVQISGQPGYTTAIERQQGFEEELAKIAPNIEILDTQPADWNREKAQRVMENFLTKYPEIDAVYSADDNMGIGALNAAKAAQRASGIIFVGATNFAVGYDAIEAGEYYGSVYQSPVEDAQNALRVAADILNGVKVEKLSYFDTPKITKANQSEFSRPVF